MSYDRPIWLAIFILASLFVAATAGLITWLISKNVGKAILTGASAFAGAVLLFIAMSAFLGGGDPTPSNAVVPSMGASTAPCRAAATAPESKSCAAAMRSDIDADSNRPG